MKTWGISALGHDASISVVGGDGEILFAAHSERYSRLKNDPYLNEQIIAEAATYGKPDQVVWYEKPLKKRLRQLYSGQWASAMSLSESPRRYLRQWEIFRKVPIYYIGHHRSHAGAGFFTSGFKRATVVVADAIGEWDTVTIWSADGNELTPIRRWTYPNSLGLLYSAFTKRVGLKPNEEEYILMGMAAYGQPIHAEFIRNAYLDPEGPLRFKENPHIGVDGFLPHARNEDLAASIQLLTEELLLEIFRIAKASCPNDDAVFMGGLALNCVANSRLAYSRIFQNIWIMPNPGDAGSSLGAVACHLKLQLSWRTPYLGTEIQGEYPVKKLLQELLSSGIAGVASGRSEFGPRALGARSLLADPRTPEVKAKVNEIKRRQNFRPFAPVILEEHAPAWFKMPYDKTPYMQFVSECKQPSAVPSICHFDNTSRVQTVNHSQHPGLYELLTKWHQETGCPLLLNTSLNIRGEPLVNDESHARQFELKYGVKVFS